MKRRRQKKPKTKLSIALDVVFILLVFIIIYAVWNLSEILMDYRSSEELYDSLQEQYVTEPDEISAGTESAAETERESLPWYEMQKVDLEGVKALNPDIVGWLYQEDGGPINYPILYSGDDDTYLRRLLDGSEATAGSIFLEAENSPDFQDSHTIIYGHNMRNLSMFGSLKKYHDQSYYETHQYFQLFTAKGIYRYQVFAYSVVNEDSPVYTVPYAPGEEFADFIRTLCSNSEIDTGVTVTDADRILTMSTCVTSGKRFVVHTVLVDAYLYEGGK